MLVDANVLLYAHDASSSFHRRASDWLTEQSSTG
jgi:predicted nucleic acid-binding protein